MIINYCSGGLGNRLKPLSSCYAVSKLKNTDLGIIWPDTMRCHSPFEKLFSNNIPNITFDELYNSNSVTIYSYIEWVHHDARLNSTYFLQRLSEKYGVHSLDNIKNILNDNNKYCIVYSNNYLDGFTSEEFFKMLLPIEELKQRIQTQIVNLQLSKDVFGVHARGTDFEPGGVTVHTYLAQILKLHQQYPTKKFFVCSDSKDYEQVIKDALPNHVILNNKTNWVYKANGGSWVNNVQTPMESVQESVIDMYLLSKTDFKIHHPDSTFAHIVKML